MTAPHLAPLPPHKVRAIVNIACKAVPMNYTTSLELEAFEETRTPHDAKRLANALGMIDQRFDLALAIGKQLKGRHTP